MESFAKRLTGLSKPSEKELIKIRDLTINKSYPIISASKNANNFGGVSVRLDLEENKFVYLPDRIASKISGEDIDHINCNSGKLTVKYVGESETKYFGKTVAQIEFQSI